MPPCRLAGASRPSRPKIPASAWCRHCQARLLYPSFVARVNVSEIALDLIIILIELWNYEKTKQDVEFLACILLGIPSTTTSLYYYSSARLKTPIYSSNSTLLLLLLLSSSPLLLLSPSRALPSYSIISFLLNEIQWMLCCNWILLWLNECFIDLIYLPIERENYKERTLPSPSPSPSPSRPRLSLLNRSMSWCRCVVKCPRPQA